MVHRLYLPQVVCSPPHRLYNMSAKIIKHTDNTTRDSLENFFFPQKGGFAGQCIVQLSKRQAATANQQKSALCKSIQQLKSENFAKSKSTTHAHITETDRERQSAEKKPTLQNLLHLCVQRKEKINKTKHFFSKQKKRNERGRTAFRPTRLSWISRECWRGLRKGVGDYIKNIKKKATQNSSVWSCAP